MHKKWHAQMRSSERILFPPVNSDEFVQTLCIFAEHLSADELAGGALLRIYAHGRSLLEHFERLILGERIPEPPRRATVVAAIGWSGQPSSTTAIRAALDDPSELVVRAGAIAAWSNMRQPRLIPKLTQLLNDPTCGPDVTVAAAQSLVGFGAGDALPAIVRLALRQPTRLSDDELEQLLASISRLAKIDFGSTELPLRQRLSRLRHWWREQGDQSHV